MIYRGRQIILTAQAVVLEHWIGLAWERVHSVLRLMYWGPGGGGVGRREGRRGVDGGWRRRGGGKHWATKGGLLYALRLSDTKSIQQEHQLHPSCKLTLQQGQDKHLNLIYNRKRHAKKTFPNLPYKSRKHIAARLGTSTNLVARWSPSLPQDCWNWSI